MANTFYVATAIPYVNDVPHVGHAMEMIYADVLSRFYRQRGFDVVFGTGTDEHGGKIMDKARSLNIPPHRYVDDMTMHFKDLWQALNIKYDRFLRTTDKAHEAAAQKIWKKLDTFIYKGTYEGMYDQKEESFVSEEEAKAIEQSDPERFSRLQRLKEENYFFKLSHFNQAIKKAIKSGEYEIVPEGRKNEVMAWLEEGLSDISISRPKAKLPWGIPVPGDEEQVMYVWFEALMNYITTLGYPGGSDARRYWPADVQIIGKDITRFHATIWPAMLMALDLDLPKRLFVHGFVTMDGKKMSKSIGNVVAPMEIISAYGADAMRYYFLRHIPSQEDGDFTWAKFEAAYNGELGDDLGNLVQRVASMANRYQNGLIGDMPGPGHDIKPYEDAINEFRFDKALEYVWNLIRGLNLYLEEEKPWEIAKQNDEVHLREVLAYAAGAIVQIAEMLWPFMPATSEKIFTVFKEGVVKNYDGVLFPRINKYTPASTSPPRQ